MWPAGCRLPISDPGYILVVELLGERAGPSSLLTDKAKVPCTVAVILHAHRRRGRVPVARGITNLSDSSKAVNVQCYDLLLYGLGAKLHLYHRCSPSLGAQPAGNGGQVQLPYERFAQKPRPSSSVPQQHGTCQSFLNHLGALKNKFLGSMPRD